jgi:nitronate monooxygenase
MGADLAYVGSAFISTHEANAQDGYKDMIVASGADDIVYSNLFTGVHGNYLKPSVAAQGLDPDALPASDASAMNFSAGSSKPKSWKEIWGAGQGIGAVRARISAAETVARLETEYRAARARLTGMA